MSFVKSVVLVAMMAMIYSCNCAFDRAVAFSPQCIVLNVTQSR